MTTRDETTTEGVGDATDRPRSNGGPTQTTSRRSVLAGLGGLLSLSTGPSIDGTSVTSAASLSDRSPVRRAAQAEDGFDHTFTRDIWEIHYYDGFETDAERVAEWLRLAQDVLTDDLYPHEYDRTTPVFLYRADEHPMGVTNAGHWFNSDGSIERSRMEMVSPSEHQLRGEDRDEWYASAIAHEYVHLPQLRDLRGSIDAPKWFTEGMAEYLANIHVLPEAGFDRAEETDIDHVIRQGDGYSFVIGSETYPGGQRLFQFLADEFGPADVTALTRSDESSLAAALAAELGLDPGRFEGRWLAWATEHVGGEYELPAPEAESTSSSDSSLRSGAEGRIEIPRRNAPESSGHFARRRRQDDEFRLDQQTPSAEAFEGTLSVPHFEVHYRDGFERDAETVADWLEAIVAAYEDLYAHPEELTTDVFLHRESDYSQHTLGGVPGEELEMVTPSDHQLSGSRRDSWYVDNIARSYVGRLIEDELPEDLPAPGWLTLGVGNYIARNHVSDELEFATERAEFRGLVEDGAAYLLQIADGNYEFEGWVTEALIDTTDGTFLRDLLGSDAESLAVRFEDDVGIHPYHVEVRYLRWLNEQFDVDYPVPSRGRESVATAAEATPAGSTRSATETADGERNETNHTLVLSTETTESDAPGFGLLGGLVGVGAGVYALKSRFTAQRKNR